MVQFSGTCSAAGSRGPYILSTRTTAGSGVFPFLHPSETLPAPVDLAIIATPISTVPDLIDSLADVQIGAAVVISAGGRETGEKGRGIEAQIKAKAISHQIRILGPNCLGLMVPGYHTNASFAADNALGRKAGICFPKRCDLYRHPGSGV